MEITTGPRARSRPAGPRRARAPAAEAGRAAGPAVHKDGLALKFVLLLVDEAVADAQGGACHLDTITLRFPEVDFVMRLARSATGHLRVAFEATFHPPGHPPGHPPSGDDARRVWWELVLPGKLGTARQRAAILREIRNARRA